EEFRVARVDLVPRTPRFREDQFRDLFKEEPLKPGPRPPETRPTAPEPAKETAATPTPDEPNKIKPVEPVFTEIRGRLSLLPLGVDVDSQTLSPDGKTLVVIADSAGQRNLYTYSLDELAKEPAVSKQLTSTAGFKRNAQFTPDGKEVFFVDQGRISAVN